MGHRQVRVLLGVTVSPHLELMVTGRLPDIPRLGGCGDVGKRASHGVRSVVATSEGTRASESV